MRAFASLLSRLGLRPSSSSDLAMAQQALQDSAGSSASVKSQVVDVSAELQRAQSMEDFAQRFLLQVVARMGGGYALFYVLDKDSGQLHAVAGLGVRSEGLPPVAVGQGLVGQCAKDLSRIVLADAGDCDIQIEWGEGTMAPKTLLVVPVVGSSALLGVVLLASLEAPSSAQQEFLDAMLPTLAMHLEVLSRNLETRRQAEVLRETEAWYRGVIESAPDGMLVADQAGVMILVNPQLERMFGYAAGALVGQNVEVLVPTAVRGHHPTLRANYTQSGAARSMGAMNRELRGVRQDGSEFPVDVGLSHLPALGGRGLCVCASVRDITQRRKDEAALAVIEERSRLILAAVGDGIVGMDTEGRITFANPAVPEMLGYSNEELVGQPMHPLVHYAYPDGKDFPRHECSMYLTSRDGQPRKVDNEVLWRKDGVALPVEYATTPVYKDGNIVGSVIIFRDITERKAAETNMRKVQYLSEQALELAGAASWELDFSQPHEFIASERAAAILGLPVKTAWHYSRQDDWHSNAVAADPVLAAQGRANFAAAVAGGLPIFDAVYRFARPLDDRPIWIRSMARIVRDGHGEPLHVYGVIQDITERKRMELELLEVRGSAHQTSRGPMGK